MLREKRGIQYSAALILHTALQLAALEYWIARSSLVKPGDDELGSSANVVARPSIIRPQIIRDAVGGVEGIEVVGIAIQQRAGLGLVIRRHIVGLL
jgi:hypothetical protein